MKKLINEFCRDESAAVAMEYSIIGSSVAVLLLAPLTLIGGKLSAYFQTASDALT